MTLDLSERAQAPVSATETVLSNARLVLAELRRQGYQDNPALSVLGQNWEQQLQGNQFLNLETLCHLLQAVILRTGHPGLGFAAGMHTDVSTHGPGGYAAVTAATIGEAIELAQHYAPLRQHLSLGRAACSRGRRARRPRRPRRIRIVWVDAGSL